MENAKLAYKTIRFNHKDNTVTLIGEYECSDKGREDAEMDCYLDKCDETSPDKQYMFTWEVVRTYKNNTKLEGK